MSSFTPKYQLFHRKIASPTPGSVWITLVFCGLVPTNSEYMIKKKLAAYSRVPGRSDQKTDFGRFGEHPRLSARFN